MTPTTRRDRTPTTKRHLVLSWTLLVPLVVTAYVGLPLLWAAFRVRRLLRRA